MKPRDTGRVFTTLDEVLHRLQNQLVYNECLSTAPAFCLFPDIMYEYLACARRAVAKNPAFQFAEGYPLVGPASANFVAESLRRIYGPDMFAMMEEFARAAHR